MFVELTHHGTTSHIDSDYIDIIDVASSGPALVNDYLNLGYRRIKLQKQ